MAGRAGSTFCAELNRIANGGTYPPLTEFLDEQGAANLISATTGWGIIAALNDSVETNRPPSQYKGLNAVCNELAGTEGLSALEALRSIESF
jgi:hypothetical protein